MSAYTRDGLWLFVTMVVGSVLGTAIGWAMSCQG